MLTATYVTHDSKPCAFRQKREEQEKKWHEQMKEFHDVAARERMIFAAVLVVGTALCTWLVLSIVVCSRNVLRRQRNPELYRPWASLGWAQRVMAFLVWDDHEKVKTEHDTVMVEGEHEECKVPRRVK